MLDNLSKAFVEAMSGRLRQAKRAAQDFITATHFIAIAYLRMSNLKQLPGNSLQPATLKYNVPINRYL